MHLKQDSMPISVHRRHILLKYIYTHQNASLPLNSDGLHYDKLTVHIACVNAARRRHRTSKGYTSSADIITRNILISQQREQILAPVFF